MKRKTSTLKNLKSRIRLKIVETGDTTMSGDDNSTIQEDGESDEDDENLSLNELKFLLAVVKAGKREIYPFTKTQFLEILETMN